MYPRASAEIASARYLSDFPARWKTFSTLFTSTVSLNRVSGVFAAVVAVWWNDDSSNALVQISDSVIHLFIPRSSEGFGDFFS